MMIDIRGENYDFLHGAIGVGFYFLYRFDHKDVFGYLDELLTELEKSAITCEHGAVKWISVVNSETGEKGYNISLSHGMSSIAAFLIRLYRLDFEIERTGNLLNRVVTYILNQMSNNDVCFSYFPSLSKESNNGYYHSRLGWCYGDLGIAPIVWQAGIALKNKEWENTALKVLFHTTNRRDLQENSIRDAGLCHGSAGVAHIFWNLFLNTGIQKFQETTNYWLEMTLQMAKHNDGLAGFKAWRKEEAGGPEKADSLIEGIAGIGIALLSYFKSDEISWDKCFMLS